MDYYHQNSLPHAAVTERGQLTAREMLNLMRDHVWEIAATTAIFLMLAGLYLLIAPKIYSADVLVRVDPPEQNALGIALQNRRRYRLPRHRP